MGINFLRDLVENYDKQEKVLIPSAVRPIDLINLGLNLSRNPQAQNKKGGNTLNLVVDGECCLNRLYGGYFSDWVCGGQWNRMLGFLADFAKHLRNGNIEMVVFINGAIESHRMKEWIESQKEDYKKVQQIFQHIDRKHTPPPKIWWIPPVGLRTAIRMMLRSVNVNVVCTIDDHRQEVIAYCRENEFCGLVADDAEYFAFDPPRLFSASQLKLTYHGTLNTKEYLIPELMNQLQLNNEKFCVLAALLGNYLLSDEDLKDVYKAAGIESTVEDNAETAANVAENTVRKLAKYINDLDLSANVDEAVKQILKSDNDRRANSLKQSIQYYLNGTKDGFLKYHPVPSEVSDKTEEKAATAANNATESNLDTTTLASETPDDKNILDTYSESTLCLENNAQEETKVENSASVENNVSQADQISEPAKGTVKKDDCAPVLPTVPHEVMRTLSERHSKGLMSPYIYQILSQGEIKLPVVLEDGTEIPNVYSFYKPIRQMVYAIVFNLHHHKFMATKQNKPLEVDIRIKEWVFNTKEKAHEAEYVKAEPVGWGVPTIQRLWFGTLQDDKRRRLRAFLTCMRSDVQLILNPDFVPQQFLVAAVVLRYMMSFPDKKVLRKQELDAFIVTSLAPEFNNPDHLQELKLLVLSRNVQLATMFMKGVEMALLVNDACGAPVPWLMCCPWLFFDGKLFHYMCQKAAASKNLQELCDNRVGLVLRTERMRQAILEGLNVQFARPPSQTFAANADVGATFRPYGNRMRMPPSNLAMSASNMNRGMPPPPPLPPAGRGGRRSLGGRLEVAGIVVGSWGANCNLSHAAYDTPPYMMSPNPYGNKRKPFKKDKRPMYTMAAQTQDTPADENLSSSNIYAAPEDLTSAYILRPKAKENGEENSESKDAESDNLLNGNDNSCTTDNFADSPVVNGAAGLIEENDDESQTIKTIHDASSSLVGTVTK